MSNSKSFYYSLPSHDIAFDENKYAELIEKLNSFVGEEHFLVSLMRTPFNKITSHVVFIWVVGENFELRKKKSLAVKECLSSLGYIYREHEYRFAGSKFTVDMSDFIALRM